MFEVFASLSGVSLLSLRFLEFQNQGNLYCKESKRRHYRISDLIKALVADIEAGAKELSEKR